MKLENKMSSELRIKLAMIEWQTANKRNRQYWNGNPVLTKADKGRMTIRWK